MSGKEIDRHEQQQTCSDVADADNCIGKKKGSLDSGDYWAFISTEADPSGSGNSACS